MTLDRPAGRRVARPIVAALVALLAVPWVAPVLADTTNLTGTLEVAERIELSPEAVAVVTLVDQTAAPDAGAIVGQARIDGPGQVPIDFAVLYDAASIDPSHSYAVFASIVDGANTWQNQVGVPVITGGPTSDVPIQLGAVPVPPAAVVSGTILPDASTPLSSQAVAIAALIKADTGTLVSRQVIVNLGASPIPFSVGYDPATIDPGATYVVKAAVVDGARDWENRTGVAAFSAGTPNSAIAVPVEIVPELLPTISPAPTDGLTEAPSVPPTEAPTPEATSEPTAAPTEAPTPAPTEAPTPAPTPEPTAAPTEAPTVAPTPAPTVAPTPEPTAAPTEAPTEAPTPAPTVAPTPEPTAAPTEAPTVAPTPEPTAAPTEAPTPSPTMEPTPTPTVAPTPAPTTGPTREPTERPSPAPSVGTVTGTLDYAEPAQLSADAMAVVVLVRGDATPTESAIVAREVIRNPGNVPIAFELDYQTSSIDPDAIYTLQATIIDGQNSWATSQGVRVITHGNPDTDIELALVYRPDLLKGQVTGSITGVGITTSPGAYSVATLIDLSTGATVGIDVTPAVTGIPIPFAVPFSPGSIDSSHVYVVQAQIIDGPRVWATGSGVPVLTNGNGFRDVEVAVTEVAAPVPSPSPAPTPQPSGGGGSGGAGGTDLGTIAVILLLLAAVGVGLFLFWWRSRGPTAPAGAVPDAAGQADPGDEVPTPSGDATVEAAAGGIADVPAGGSLPPPDAAPAPGEGPSSVDARGPDQTA